MNQAVTLDSSDQTNGKDKDLMNTLLHQVEMLNRFTSDDSDKDYDRAVTYCTNILTNCPASVQHSVLKCEYLLRAY